MKGPKKSIYFDDSVGGGSIDGTRTQQDLDGSVIIEREEGYEKTQSSLHKIASGKVIVQAHEVNLMDNVSKLKHLRRERKQIYEKERPLIYKIMDK
mmetsp:Transcript_29629/g.45167  ORF Transcript_29629/g.45167 Transcript_29629/m.45167 type:complete len:96 (+) Transcript_29629:1097-1384(+)